MRGALSGVIWGTVVSGVVLGVTSVATLPPGPDAAALAPLAPQRSDAGAPAEAVRPDPGAKPESAEAAAPPELEDMAEDAGSGDAPEADAPETEAASATSRADERDGADESTASEAQAPKPAVPSAPPPPSDAPDLALDSPDMAVPMRGVETVPEADTASAGQPQIDSSEAAMAAPEDGSDSGIAVQTDAPVIAGANVAQPSQPLPEEDLSISTDPAQPPAPDAEEGSAAFPTAGAQGDPAGDAAGDETMAMAQTSDPADTAPIVQDEAPEVAPPAEDGTQGAFDTGQAAKPAGEAPETDPVISDLPRVIEETGPDPQDGLETAQGPSIGRRAGDLERFGDGVRISRPAEEDAAEAPPAVDPGAASTRPLEAFAAPVEMADDKPLMAIVLIDDGTSVFGVEALTAFPYPLTFAVDASLPNAREIMAGYRAEGFEVVAMVGMPGGSTARDAEVALEANLAAVPEAVAVMESPGNGLQGSREVSDQVAAILGQSGHGLLLFPKGLNTAEAIAERAGVPAETIYRDLDPEGEDAQAIRRVLDQAAMKAWAVGGVIATGRLRADTISALLLWGLQDRASQVALVPVSAVLTRSDDP